MRASWLSMATLPPAEPRLRRCRNFSATVAVELIGRAPHLAMPAGTHLCFEYILYRLKIRWPVRECFTIVGRRSSSS